MRQEIIAVDMLLYLKAALLGLLEGATAFLPVSSTGHLIIAADLDPAAQRFVAKLFIAFLPAAVLGLLLHKTIKAHLFNPISVASALVLGGFVILWIESRR